MVNSTAFHDGSPFKMRLTAWSPMALICPFKSQFTDFILIDPPGRLPFYKLHHFWKLLIVFQKQKTMNVIWVSIDKINIDPFCGGIGENMSCNFSFLSGRRTEAMSFVNHTQWSQFLTYGILYNFRAKVPSEHCPSIPHEGQNWSMMNKTVFHGGCHGLMRRWPDSAF